MIKCPRCHQETPESKSYCKHCGLPTRKFGTWNQNPTEEKSTAQLLGYKKKTQNLAPVWKRALAFLIDIALLSIITISIKFIIDACINMELLTYNLILI